MERPSDCLEPAASGAVGLGHQAGSMPEPDMGRGNGAALTSLKVAWGLCRWSSEQRAGQLDGD